jgi:AbrB family looped-hinge helix DNA binding protein
MRKDSTRISSKGQVVIPAWVRRKLLLQPGEELTVELGPDGERTIVLRGRSAGGIEEVLEKGYRWIRQNRIDMVGSLHDSRRKARVSEQRRRRP